MSSGKGGGDIVIGYKYYLGVHMALAHGPLDNITRIEVDKRIAWEGLNTGGPLTIEADELFGGDDREGGISGTVDIEMGLPSQGQNNYLLSVLGDELPAFRGVACAVLNQAYVGNNPYIKPWAFRCQRIFAASNGADQWNTEFAEIGDADCGASCDAILSVGASIGHQTARLYGGSDYTTSALAASGSAELVETGDGYTTTTSAGDIPSLVSKFDFCGDIERVTSFTGGAGSGTFYLRDRDTLMHWGAQITALVKQCYNSGSDNGYVVCNFPHDLYINGAFVRTINFQGAVGIRNTSVGGLGNRQFYHGGPSGTEYSLIQNQDDIEDWSYCCAYVDGKTIGGPYWGVTGWLIDIEVVSQIKLGGSLSDSTQSSFIFLGGTITDDVVVVPTPNPGAAFLTQAMENLDGYIAMCSLSHGIATDFNCLPFDSAFENACDCSDMNPAHIIRECLTNAEWGMGYADLDIDDESFEVAAETLHDEDMGISILWTREEPLEDFISEILRHIDGTLYVSRETGKFVLTLIRDLENDTSLIVLDQSNIASVSNAKRPTVGELTSSVTVQFWDRETGEQASYTEHNWPLIQIQGAQTHTTIQYPGFTNYAIAQQVALRDLIQLSTPLLSCKVEASREAATLNIGDGFILDWPDLEINNIVMRVQKMSLGDGRKNSIVLECVEDVFALPGAIENAAPEPDLWIDPSLETPLASVPRLVTEAPYYEIVRNQTQRVADDIIADNNDVGFLLAAGGRQQGELNARVYVDAGTGYSNSAQLDFSPHAYLLEPIDFDTTQIYFSGGVDLDEVSLPAIAQIGEEIIRVDAISEDSSGDFMIVGRGVLDTVPQQHGMDSVGADSNATTNRTDAILIWGDDAATDGIEYSASELLDVKLQTVRGQNSLPLDATPSNSVTFSSRAFRPYPPGRLAIDGESYPTANDSTEIYYSGDHSITWAHRDRLQQTDGNLYDYTEGDIGPEDGTTYRIDLTSILHDGTESAPWWTIDGITGTSFTMDSNTDTSRGEPVPDTDLVKVTVTSLRDGYESWQSPYALLSYVSDSVGDSVGDSAGDSAGIDSIGSFFDSTVSSDPHWDDVVLLLQADKADASTTFTDESSAGTTITSYNNVQYDTAQAFVGTSSILCDGTSDYLSIPMTSTGIRDGGYLLNPFTIDMAVRPASIGSPQALVSCRQQVSGSAERGFTFRIDADGTLQVYCFNGTGSVILNVSSTETLSADTWHEISLVHDGTLAWEVWLDGTKVIDASATGQVVTASTFDLLRLGDNFVNNSGMDGWLDRLRVTTAERAYSDNTYTGLYPTAGP